MNKRRWYIAAYIAGLCLLAAAGVLTWEEAGKLIRGLLGLPV